jgi:hypothetical protein
MPEASRLMEYLYLWNLRQFTSNPTWQKHTSDMRERTAQAAVQDLVKLLLLDPRISTI